MVQPPPYQDAAGSARWAEWYRQMNQEINAITSVAWSVIDFTGSDLADLATATHNTTTAKQGGAGTEFYHLTLAQHTALTGPVLETRLDINIYTTTQTLTINDAVVYVDSTAGAFTVTLPDGSAGLDGKVLYIKLIAGTAAVTIDANASDTIDGATTQVLSYLYDALTLQYSSTKDAWYIL